MTPIQKVKWMILTHYATMYKQEKPPYPCENIDELYSKLEEDDNHVDAKNDIRYGQVSTNLPCDFLRNYDSKAVAIKLPDNSWVGWTFFYGGGKHSEPEAIDWMNDAYDVNCKEEQKMVTIQTFSIPNEK